MCWMCSQSGFFFIFPAAHPEGVVLTWPPLEVILVANGTGDGFTKAPGVVGAEGVLVVVPGGVGVDGVAWAGPGFGVVGGVVCPGPGVAGIVPDPPGRVPGPDGCVP